MTLGAINDTREQNMTLEQKMTSEHSREQKMTSEHSQEQKMTSVANCRRNQGAENDIGAENDTYREQKMTRGSKK